MTYFTQIAVILFAYICIASANDKLWSEYKKTFNRNFISFEEEIARKEIFTSKIALITEHNVLFDLGLKNFSLGINQFTDMPDEQFKVEPNPGLVHNERMLRKPQIWDSLPAEVDWRKKGVVTRVKDQGTKCLNAGYAFSSAAAIESAHAIATGKLVELSEQFGIDCSTYAGNHGCKGGVGENLFTYVFWVNGIATEQSYPWTGSSSSRCQLKPQDFGASISGLNQILDEDTMKRAVATIGLVSVMIDGSEPSFRAYSGGIYDDPKCSPYKSMHSVAVVGYGTEAGVDYWLVKNSWGESWGEKGYMKLIRGKGNFGGILNLSSFPVV